MTVVMGQETRKFTRYLQSQGYQVPSDDVLEVLSDRWRDEVAMVDRLEEAEYDLEEKTAELVTFKDDVTRAVGGAREDLAALLDKLASACAYDPIDSEHRECARHFDDLGGLLVSLRDDVLDGLAEIEKAFA